MRTCRICSGRLRGEEHLELGLSVIGTGSKKGTKTVRVSDIPEIAQLSTPEKILLVEDLWDSIASDAAGVFVPQSHKEELGRRLKNYASHPGNLLSLEELQARIERRK